MIYSASCNEGTNSAPCLHTQRRRLIEVRLRVNSDHVIRVAALGISTISAVRVDMSNQRSKSPECHTSCCLANEMHAHHMLIMHACSLGVLGFAIAPWASPWALQLLPRLARHCLASLGHKAGRNSTPGRPQTLPSTLQPTH